MNTQKQVVLCIPTLLVTLIFGFVPWGLVATAITLALYAFVLFLPSKTLVRVNSSVALEGLTYGDISGAKEHVEIALREAEGSTNLSAEDLDLLRRACDKVASALSSSGQAEAANSLRKQGDSVAARLAQRS